VVASESGEAGNPGTLGMTILFGNDKYGSKMNCHPERSRGICGAPLGLPKFRSSHADSKRPLPDSSLPFATPFAGIGAGMR
jgi:hypothetical protein